MTNQNFYKGYLQFVVLGLIMLFMGVDVQGTHISGGSIKYKSLGSNQWYIEAAVFRDCAGATYSSFTETLDVECVPTGLTSTPTVTHLAFVAPTPAPFGGPYAGVTVTSGGNSLVAEEISDVCDNILNPNTTPNSRCRGNAGGAQGYLRFKFSGILTLTPCAWQRVGFQPVCCRNTGGSNTSSSNMYVHTFFNSLNFPNNSAPDFADEVKPIPSACIGKKVFYGIGTIDNDGDSLRFELNCALQSATACVVYANGFSATAPASGLIMDSATGLIEFTPATGGKRVVAFWVKEYERCTGVLKAQTLRDVQFRIETCSNNVPRDISGISNIQGDNYTRVSDFQLEVCNGEYISFEDTIVDIDSTVGTLDTLVFQSNFNKVLPGATMSINYLSRTKAVVRWNWRASIGLNPVKIFYLVFNDNYCQYPGNGFSVFELNVRNSTNAGRDTAVCRGDTVRLDASGGKLYQWKSVWGDSLYFSGPNRNVWSDTTVDDTNRTMKFLPSKTTLLEVWSDLQEGCVKAQACSVRDSVQITVASPFKLTTSLDTTICFEDSTIQIETRPDSVQFGYSYKWAPHTSISEDTVFNPMVTPLTSRMYYVTVESDSGCSRSDSSLVNVTLPLPRNIVASTISDPTCVGIDAPIDLKIGFTPTTCGASNEVCYSSREVATSNNTTTTNAGGSGTASPVASWPCPYGAAEPSARMQFMYTSAELQAMGLNGGVIDALGFNVVNVRGAQNFSNYTIKLACTTSPQFVNSFAGNLTTVFNPKNITIAQGWNMHTFDVNYEIASGNNLIVEICFDNTGVATTSNAAVAISPTAATFNSCITTYGTGPRCTDPTPWLASRVNRPNLKLSFCGQRDSSEFTYKWTPSLGLNFDTVKNPIANIDSSMTYTVTLTDTAGGCQDTTSLKINIASIDAGPDTSMCPNDSVQLFPDVVTSCGGNGVFVWTPSQYFKDDSVKNAIVSVPKTTMVTVTFHDNCGCALTDSLMVYADSLKEPDMAMYNPDCGLSNGRIKINAVGGFGPYLFSLDSGRTFNAVDTFINQRIGFYNAQIIDSIGCISPMVADTLFNDNAPQITALIPKDVSCAGFADGEIRIETKPGVGVPSFQYSVDAGQNWGPDSVVKNLKPGNYVVYARGNLGCTSFPERISLSEPDSFKLRFSTIIDSCFNVGLGEAKGVVTGGIKPYTFTWAGVSPNATHLPLQVADTVITKLFAYDSYSLKVLDSNGCEVDTTFEILESDELLYDSISISEPACFDYMDAKIFVGLKGGTGPFEFSIDSANTMIIPTPTSADWIELDTTDGPIKALPIGNYNITTIDKYGCRIDSLVTVTQPPLMQLTTPQDSFKICVNTCAKLEVNSSGGNSLNHNYNWTPAITTINVAPVCPTEKENLFTVYASDEKGCISNTVILKVNLFDSLRIDMPTDTAICDGAFVEFDANATGGDGTELTYLWQPFANLTNAFIKNPIASPEEDVTYTLTVNDKCGSPEVMDSVKISILPQPIVDFSTDSLTGCPPFEVYFDNKTNDSYRCTWEFGDGSEATTCGDVTKLYSQSGTYNVKLKVIGTDGCVDSLVRDNYLTIHPVPLANFSMSPQPTTIMDSELDFTDLSEGKVNQYEWNFSSIDTSQEANPKFKFPDEEKGIYPVKLEVTNIFGCSDDTIRNVNIDPQFFMYVPSSFTPNGDGKNDVWKPVGAGFEADYYDVSVYDRWGTQVFATSNYADGWDGTINESGEKAAVGVYTWRVVISEDGSEKSLYERFGTVTIVK